jgi:hypothetical protein
MFKGHWSIGPCLQYLFGSRAGRLHPWKTAELNLRLALPEAAVPQRQQWIKMCVSAAEFNDFPKMI